MWKLRKEDVLSPMMEETLSTSYRKGFGWTTSFCPYFLGKKNQSIFSSLWCSQLSFNYHFPSSTLPQGPLPTTCGHFWLMCWEQNTKAVLMLNRTVERGRVGSSRMSDPYTWANTHTRAHEVYEQSSFVLFLVTFIIFFFPVFNTILLWSLCTQISYVCLCFYYFHTWNFSNFDVSTLSQRRQPEFGDCNWKTNSKKM